MKLKIKNAKLKMGPRLAVLFILHFAFCIFNCEANQVRMWFLNTYTGLPDTNAIIATKISSNVLASGGVVAQGIPKRIIPATNGYATNYFEIGWYSLSNVALMKAPVVINVYDSSTNAAAQVDYTNLLQSGFNTYAVTVYGTNPAPTLTEVTNALGFLPLTPTVTTNAITNKINEATNTVYGWLGTAAFQTTNFFYRTNQNMQFGSTILSNFVTLGTNAFFNRADNLQTGSTILSNFVTLGTNAFYNTNANLQAGSTVLSNFATLGTNAFYNTNRNLQSGSTVLSNFVTLGTNAFYNTNANLQSGSTVLSNFVTLTTNAFYNTNANLQAGSVNLTNFSALTTNAFYNTNRNLQAGSVNLTNWSALATNAFYNTNANLQAGSVNLTNWSALSTNVLGNVSGNFQTGSVNLTNWSTFETNKFYHTNRNLQAGSVNLTNFSALTTNAFVSSGSGTVSTNLTVNSNLFVGGWITVTNFTGSRALVSDANRQLTNSAVSISELERLVGVTGGVQTNIDARTRNNNGVVTNLTLYGTTAIIAGGTFKLTGLTDSVIYVDGGSEVVASIVSPTELEQLNNISGNVQTNIDARIRTVDGIATNSLTVKGNLSVTTNAWFNTLTVTNLQTNSALIYADAGLRAAADIILTNTGIAKMQLHSPRTNDTIGSILFRGLDTATNQVTYATITASIVSGIDGEEAGKLDLNVGGSATVTIQTNLLQIAGGLSFTNSLTSGITNLTTIGNGDNDISPGNYYLVAITTNSGTPSAAWNLNAIAGGWPGKQHWIVNQSGYQMTVKHESLAAGTATNRLRVFGVGADLVTPTNGVIWCYYDANLSRWIVGPATGTNFTVNNAIAMNANQFSATASTNIKSGALLTNVSHYDNTHALSNFFVSQTNFVNRIYITNGFQFTNGAANGYFLVSDANGNGVWTAPSGASFSFNNNQFSGTTTTNLKSGILLTNPVVYEGAWFSGSVTNGLWRWFTNATGGYQLTNIATVNTKFLFDTNGGLQLFTAGGDSTKLYTDASGGAGETVLTNTATSQYMRLGVGGSDIAFISGSLQVADDITFGSLTSEAAALIDFNTAASVAMPSAAGPTTDTEGKVAFDNNAWAASRGALQIFDGTANTYAVAALASDTPSNGQVPTWNTGGTITWETPSGGGGGNNYDTNYFTTNAASLITFTNFVTTNIAASRDITVFERYVASEGAGEVLTLPTAGTTNGFIINFAIVGSTGSGTTISNSQGNILGIAGAQTDNTMFFSGSGNHTGATFVKRETNWLIFNLNLSQP